MTMRALLTGLLVLGTISAPLAADAVKDPLVPSFAEETATAGIDSTYSGDWDYITGGGAASFDCNADGFPDLLLAGGEEKANFYLNRSSPGGALKFEKSESGLELTEVNGAYPLDIDSDGIMDVVLMRIGKPAVMRGLGACRFERMDKAWNFPGMSLWWSAFAATWEKGANWPTLVMGSYISLTQSTDLNPWGSCTGTSLLRPNETGTGFADAVPLKPSYCPLSMVFTDWNRSGTPSLRVSNDREYYRGGSEQLFHFEPGKPPVAYTDKEGWKPLRIWGMGIASADVNADGYPDYFLSSMADNKLQILASPSADGRMKPDYNDVAFALGAVAQKPYTGPDQQPSTAWHAEFDDVNNDGRPDLFVAKGNISDMLDFAMQDPNNLLLLREDGKFVEAGDKAGVASMEQSRGGVLTDFNLDGRIDLLVVNRNSKAQIWRNSTDKPGHFIEVKLEQPAPNRDALNAWIVVTANGKKIEREIFAGAGQGSGETGWWHTGIGEAESVELQVIWPDGEKSEPATVKADGFYIVRRGSAPEAWTPGTPLR